MKELKTIPTSRHGPADDSKGCCTPSLPLPRDNFLISQEVISHLLHWRHQIPFFPHSGCPFWSKAAGFPSPPHPGQNSTTISNFQASPPLPFCCSTLPEGAQVLPGGNDCYLQDTLHIISTPFGVFRPSSFCCISHFTPRSRVLKDQGLLLAGESR